MRRTKIETREEFRPGSPCEHCGHPMENAGTVTFGSIEFDVGLCCNDQCPGKSPSPTSETPNG
jgi:hypothetical protein